MDTVTTGQVRRLRDVKQKSARNIRLRFHLICLLFHMRGSQDRWGTVSAAAFNQEIEDLFVIFVLNSLAVGGSEIKIMKVANALTRSGVDVHLAHLADRDSGRSWIDPTVKVSHLGRRGKYSPTALRRLSQLISNDGELVIAVNLYPLLYVIPAVKRSSCANVRAACLVNTIELTGREVVKGKLYSMMLKHCDATIFGCNAQREQWINRYRLSASTSHVIYNGVDCNHFSPTQGVEEGVRLRNRLGIPNDAVIMGSTGRLAPEKSFDLLIHALPEIRSRGHDAYVVIAGEGRQRASLEALASDKGVSAYVKLLGLVGDVRPALSMMDIFILPSSAVETFSNASLEAMAMGRAIVLSRLGGAAEMIEHGTSGMLFDVGNIPQLTDAAARLCESKSLREQMGAAARERAVRMFAFSTMVEQYRNLNTQA